MSAQERSNFATFLPPALLFALLSTMPACRTTQDTVVGRANGRDIVVTETEIQNRISDRGVTRAVALRELRRESEIRAALETQRKWKSTDNVYVESAKSRSTTDQPESPDKEAIAELIAKEQERRATLREAINADAEREADAEQESPPATSDDEIVSKLALPEQRAVFEDAPENEGWQQLPERRAVDASVTKARQAEKNLKTQVPQ